MKLLERTHTRPVRKHQTVTANRAADMHGQPPHLDVEDLVEAGRDAIAETLSDKPADFLKGSRQLGAE